MKRTRWWPLVGLVLLAGCELFSGPERPRPPLTQLPRSLSAGEERVIQGSNAFAFGLLREVRARDTTSANVFLSPLSASMALGMALTGARGATLEEMGATLGFAGMTREEIGDSYRSLIDLLLGLDTSVQMEIANSVWLRRGFPVNPDYLAAVSRDFDARAAEVDFTSPAAPDTINAWVDRATHGRIPRIVDQIRREEVAFLVNAVYFKGSWTERFDRARTRSAPFHLADGGIRTLPMMHAEKVKLRWRWSPEVVVADLPYGRGAFAMSIVLPTEGESLEELVRTLDDATWRGWMAELREAEVSVALPRFRVDYARSLGESLKALGMRTPFDTEAADFGDISPIGDALFVQRVLPREHDEHMRSRHRRAGQARGVHPQGPVRGAAPARLRRHGVPVDQLQRQRAVAERLLQPGEPHLLVPRGHHRRHQRGPRLRRAVDVRRHPRRRREELHAVASAEVPP